VKPPYIFGSTEIKVSSCQWKSEKKGEEIPIFDILLETSTLMEGVSSSGILVKLVMLRMFE
jgi:hypothetical protein